MTVRIERAPVSSATRDRLRRDCNTTQAVMEAAARAGRTLDARDAYREFRVAQDHFELGCWLVHYRLLIKGEGGDQARCECAEFLLEHGLMEPTRNFETVFGFGVDCYLSVFAQRPTVRAC
ncbi:hypothetical protein QE400_000100 [Xanthomonas sacchari]|uniref:hypothetical protein n=1 Tax=Xanthomonas sacchari TaxID=56458 RepID=UPI002788A30F|nr:hypothetical protein [Xanthomonas sacchari]MDQ1090687.1 hypothetical protein [Xanthomonas sacchari]